jgi:hypothetical protein
MHTATIITRWIVRLAGLTQIILGVAFWTGNALSLIPTHMLVGSIVVLGLWTLAVLAARAKARPGVVALAILWGLVLPVFGVMHAGILPGSLHWIIQVVHLLLGLGALRMAEGLAAHVLRRSATRSSPEPLGYGPVSRA